MKNSDQDSLNQQIMWGMDRGAFNDQLGKSLVRAWQVGADDSIVRKLIADKLRPLQKLDATGELAPFKAARLPKGELFWGKDPYGSLINLHLDWLSSGLLIASNTGGGKSNLVCFLALQLGALGCPIWLSESYKTQLRHLRPLFKRVGVELIILRPLDWRWNLLQSHLQEPRTQLTMAVDLLVRVLNLPPRSRTILAQGCHALYKQFGIWERKDVRAWPTLFDLFEWTRKTRDLNTQARDAILDRLGSLLLNLTPKCAAYRIAWNPYELAYRSICFEMRGTSETAKQVLLESLLLSVFQREVERGVVNGPLRLVIAFDDSQRFFDTSSQSAAGDLAPMDELAGIIRGTGISIWVIVQTMVGLSRRLVPNLATKCFSRCGSAEDYASLGADLGMTAEQIAFARLHLQPGQFIGQTAHEWRHPFLFRVPLLKLTERTEDWEADESVKSLETLPTVFAEEFTHWSPTPVTQIKDTVAPAGGRALSEADLRFLKTVIQNPGKPSSVCARLAGLGSKQGVEIRLQLVQAGYVREHQIATGRQGRQAIVLEPLRPALDAVADAGGTR